MGEERPAQRVDSLHDLALDQAFAQIGDEAPRAASAFRAPLLTTPEVEYRQAIFRGLEHQQLRATVETFLRGMSTCERRDRAASKAHYPYEDALGHLSAVAEYVRTIATFCAGLTEAMSSVDVRSEGLERLRRHVADYRSSPGFGALESEATGLQGQFAAVRYNALIRGPKVTIAPADAESDLGEAVLSTFERFRSGEVTDHRTAFRSPDMDHVQARMLERVARVHPEPFTRLVCFARETREYRDRVLSRFTGEVRFYLAYLDYVAPMRRAGLPMSYPTVSTERKDLAVREGWDLVLAARLVKDSQPVVTNDLTLAGRERILVISGPNQGGKTTTARMFGQVHHLAAIGCPIPGRHTQVFLCDHVLTVFEREEQLDSLEGRLGAEVQRLHAVFEAATDRSVLVINEAFASTALHDARILTRDVLERISRLDALAACVTFIDELSRLNDATVSMVGMVDPADPAVRTLRVERRRADGRAYARALAAKHGLTLQHVRRRLDGPGQAATAGATEGVCS